MIAKIANIAEVQGGMVLSRKEAKSPNGSSYKYKRLTLRSFDENGNIHLADLEDFYACERLDNSLFTEIGDVVVRLVSPMYPIYIEPGEENILVPSQFAVLRLNEHNCILPEYLRLCLAQKTIQNRILELESGTTQKAVKIKTILDLEISIPPLSTQEKAVQIDRISRYRKCAYLELIKNEQILTDILIEKMIGGTD